MISRCMQIPLLRKIYYDILPFSIQAYLTKIIFKPKFGWDMIISKGTKFFYGDVSFGNGTRIAANSVFSNVTVGNYTVFGQDFRILGFAHDYNAFTINTNLPEMVKADTGGGINEPGIRNYPQTIIGNDVWIGEFVTVKGGVQIGDGAVVGARSVVTHDIPPFAIVAGVPARFIKWRFDKEKIELMQEIKWWEWDKERIARNYERLCSFDMTLKNDVN